MTRTTSPRGLGRIARFDERSRNYPARGAEQITSQLWSWYGPRLDQLTVGSCTGHGMAHACNCKGLRRPRTPYKGQEDALRIYTRATELDPYPGTYPHQDTGSSVLAAAFAAREAGWIAKYEWAFGFQHMLSALQFGPVEVGVNWYESFNSPSAAGYIDISGDVEGGHAFAVNGINMRDRFVWAIQSWGPGWGLKGRFKIPFSIMDRLLREDGDCMRPVLELAA